MATCLPSQKLSKLDEPETQDTAREVRTSSSVMYFYGPPRMAEQKKDDHLEHTYSTYVRIRDVALKNCWSRWTIGSNGEGESGISMLADTTWWWWWWWLLLCITNDSIKHQSLVYTQLNDQTIQFSISHLFALSLNVNHSGYRSNGNEGFHSIPKSYNITWVSLSDCLVSYQDNHWGNLTPLQK